MPQVKSTTKIATGLGFIGLAIVTIIGAVILEITDHDPSRIFTFALAIVPLLLVQLYQGNERAKDADDIKTAVNGKLTAQLNDIKTHVTESLQEMKGLPNDVRADENRDS